MAGVAERGQGKGRHTEPASRQGEAYSPLVVAQHTHDLPFADGQYPSNGVDGLLLPLLQLLLAVHDVGSLPSQSPGSAGVSWKLQCRSVPWHTQLLMSGTRLGITFFAVVSTSACESKSKSSSSEPPP